MENNDTERSLKEDISPLCAIAPRWVYMSPETLDDILRVENWLRETGDPRTVSQALADLMRENEARIFPDRDYTFTKRDSTYGLDKARR